MAEAERIPSSELVYYTEIPSWGHKCRTGTVRYSTYISTYKILPTNIQPTAIVPKWFSSREEEKMKLNHKTL